MNALRTGVRSQESGARIGLWKTCAKGGEDLLIIAASKKLTQKTSTLWKKSLRFPNSESLIDSDYNDRNVIRPAARVGGLDESFACFLNVVAVVREDLLNIPI
jgi:hypothetical protein